MHHALKAIEQFFPYEEHPFFQSSHSEDLTQSDFYENSYKTWVPHYLTHKGMATYRELESQYDIVVLCGVNEFLHQYLLTYQDIEWQIEQHNSIQITRLRQELMRADGKDFTFQVNRAPLTKIGYFDLRQLFHVYDQLVPNTLKGQLQKTDQSRYLRDSLTSGQRSEITALAELHSMTTDCPFSIEDILTSFKLPYYLKTSQWFNYSFLPTALICISCLGPNYSQLIKELVPYYGSDALTEYCEDNGVGGERAPLANLWVNDKDTAVELAKQYRINVDKFIRNHTFD